MTALFIDYLPGRGEPIVAIRGFAPCPILLHRLPFAPGSLVSRQVTHQAGEPATISPSIISGGPTPNQRPS